MSASPAFAATPQRPLAAVLWGGLLAGIGDITQAFVVFGIYGAKPFRILQSIPRGIFGARTFQMGWESALLGIVLHFTIATTAAAVYYLASRKLRFMTEHPVISGLLYGECVFGFMYFVVMPLSAIGWPKITMPTWITGPIGHTLLVGLPIALCVKRFAPLQNRSEAA